MLTHSGTQTIKTERLTLRKFTVSDAQYMFENWACDERVTRFLTWEPHVSPDATRELLTSWCALYENPFTYNWAIEYEGKAVGNISIVRMSDRDEWMEIGYCLGFEYWNKGIMSEAAGVVIDYLFENVNVNRIGIDHAFENPASGKVAQKCGLKCEGVKREYFRMRDGKFVDIVQYSILRREWEERRR